MKTIGLVSILTLSISMHSQEPRVAIDCTKVTRNSPLASKLACTPNHIGQRLGTALRPVAEHVSLTGTVIVSGEGVEQPRLGTCCFDFDYDGFLDINHRCITNRADGDFTFYMKLDRPSARRLRAIRALDPWRPLVNTEIVHVEAIAFGRNVANANQALFPGWHDPLFPLIVNGKSATGFVTCLGERGCLCTDPRLDGQDLRGRRVTVEGSLVVDCNGATCEDLSTFVELHPACRVRIE